MIEIDGRQILTTLPEKAAPASPAVIVIDCQHEFIAEDGEAIVPPRVAVA